MSSLSLEDSIVGSYLQVSPYLMRSWFEISSISILSYSGRLNEGINSIHTDTHTHTHTHTKKIEIKVYPVIGRQSVEMVDVLCKTITLKRWNLSRIFCFLSLSVCLSVSLIIHRWMFSVKFPSSVWNATPSESQNIRQNRQNLTRIPEKFPKDLYQFQ